MYCLIKTISKESVRRLLPVCTIIIPKLKPFIFKVGGSSPLERNFLTFQLMCFQCCNYGAFDWIVGVFHRFGFGKENWPIEDVSPFLESRELQ